MKYWTNGRGDKYRALAGEDDESFNYWIDYFDTVDWQIGDLARSLQKANLPRIKGIEGFADGYAYLKNNVITKWNPQNVLDVYVDAYVYYLNSKFLDYRITHKDLMKLA